MDSIALIVAGFVGGFVGSQVGSGNVLTLPPLLVLGLPLPLAVGTNAISGWLINVVAGGRYWREGLVDLKHLFPLAGAAGVGAVLGAHLLFAIDPVSLSRIAAGAVAGSAATVAFLPRRHAADRQVTWSRPQEMLAIPVAFLLGVYGGVIALGLSTIGIVALLAVGHSRNTAVANAVTLSAVLLTVASAYYMIHGRIVYSYAVPLAAGSVLGASVGARTFLAHGSRYFRPLLLAAVIVIVVRLGVMSDA